MAARESVWNMDVRATVSAFFQEHGEGGYVFNYALEVRSRKSPASQLRARLRSASSIASKRACSSARSGSAFGRVMSGVSKLGGWWTLSTTAARSWRCRMVSQLDGVAEEFARRIWSHRLEDGVEAADGDGVTRETSCYTMNVMHIFQRHSRGVSGSDAPG